MASRIAFAALVASTSIFALTAHAQTTAPITEIRLSSGGLAEVRRQVEVKDNAALTLTVPLDQVDDVLKSLTIRDPKGSMSSASLAGKQPLAEVFKNLPFSANDLSAQSSLLAALQGAAVTVSGDGRQTKGRIVGVEEAKVQGKNDDTITRYRLTVFSTGKLVTFDLDKVDVTLEDEALRAKLETALNAVQTAKAGDTRDISVAITGSGARSIAIDYVVPAPIWKATYRLALPKDGDKADIQGWAVIENNSSDDWKNVKLSLSSGSPLTLHQRLHEAYYAQRPQVPVYGPSGIVPLADKGGEIAANAANKEGSDQFDLQRKSPASPATQKLANAVFGMEAATAPSGRLRADVASPIPHQGYGQAESATLATEADVTTLFTLPNPIALARGQSLTMPFISAAMIATRVSVFQPQLGINNPVAAVMVKNDSATSLPPGILTLTEDGSGYAGDAQLAGLPAGETRMVMFATDRKVVVTTDGQSDQKITQLSYDNGALKADMVVRTNVTYKIKGAADADRTVIVEYPRRVGFTYTSEQKESETPTAIRLKVSVPKGSVAETKLTEQRVVSSTYALTDIESRGQALAVWSQQAVSDPKLLAKLKDASDALTKLNEAKQALTNYDAEVERIKSDQERVRENLQAVPATSDLAKTYLANMTAQEKRLTEIGAWRGKGEEAIASARKVLSEKLKAF